MEGLGSGINLKGDLMAKKLFVKRGPSVKLAVDICPLAISNITCDIMRLI